MSYDIAVILKTEIETILALPANTKGLIKQRTVSDFYQKYRGFLKNFPMFLMQVPALQEEILILLKRISLLLNGLIEPIEDAGEHYFREYFARTGKIVEHIRITPKKAGQQLGTTLWIKYNSPQTPSQEITYHIKTHQHGAVWTAGRAGIYSTMVKVDLKELLVYKILEYTGFGPKAHFILSPLHLEGALYIATQNSGFTKNPEKQKSFVIYEHFQSQQKESLLVNPIDQHGLFRIEMLLRILRLHDLTTNSGNFGKVLVEPSHKEQWKIIDFRVNTVEDYHEMDIVNQFKSGSKIMSYPPLLINLLALRPISERMHIAHEVIKEFEQGKHRDSHEEFKTPLVKSIEQALAEISTFAISHADDLGFNLEIALADLNCYVEGVLDNLQVLSLGVRQSL